MKRKAVLLSYIDSPRKIEFLKSRRTRIYGRDYKSGIIRLLNGATHKITAHKFSALTRKRVLIYSALKRAVSFCGRIKVQPAQKWAGSFVRKVNTRLKRPITLREALIIALIVWIFLPSQHQAHGLNAPVASKLYSVPSDIKPLTSPVLQPVSELASVHVISAPTAPVQSADYYVNWIIQHESGGNPNAVNPNSGACGLFQRLPCSVPLGNVAVQMADGLAYINSRYGSAYNAYLYWIAHGNY